MPTVTVYSNCSCCSSSSSSKSSSRSSSSRSSSSSDVVHQQCCMDDPPLTLTASIGGVGDVTLTFGTPYPVLPFMGTIGWAGSFTMCGRNIPIYMICGWIWVDLPPDCGTTGSIGCRSSVVCPPFLLIYEYFELPWNCGGGCTGPIDLKITVSA